MPLSVASAGAAPQHPDINKAETVDHIEGDDQMHSDALKDGTPLMRSQVDNLSVWESVKRYRVVTVISMLAAFSAALDGYRKLEYKRSAQAPINVP